jgi:hypothetical protein
VNGAARVQPDTGKPGLADVPREPLGQSVRVDRRAVCQAEHESGLDVAAADASRASLTTSASSGAADSLALLIHLTDSTPVVLLGKPLRGNSVMDGLINATLDMRRWPVPSVSLSAWTAQPRPD